MIAINVIGHEYFYLFTCCLWLYLAAFLLQKYTKDYITFKPKIFLFELLRSLLIRSLECNVALQPPRLPVSHSYVRSSQT